MLNKSIISIIIGIILLGSISVYGVPSGGTITTILDGGVNYTVHTFTTNGTFNTDGFSLNLTFLLVAGGGAGALQNGGGGGAGGLNYTTSYSFSGTATVIVGAGGIGDVGNSQDVLAKNGTSSSFGGTTVTGGGAGGGNGVGIGSNGGSGGGGGYGSGTTGGVGISGQGNNGGNAAGAPGYSGGGGGGAGGIGANSGTGGNLGGNGGLGLNYSIDGTNRNYSCGGGGGTRSGTGGTSCGGGYGASAGGRYGGNATYGGGGGSIGYVSGSDTAGSGGAGIVIIRYKTADLVAKYSIQGNINYNSVAFPNAQVTLMSENLTSVIVTVTANSSGGFNFASLNNNTYYIPVANYRNSTAMLTASSYVWVNTSINIQNLDFYVNTTTTTTTNCVVNYTNWYFVPDGCTSSS